MKTSLLLAVLLGLVGCSDAYRDLASKYGSDRIEGDVLAANSIVITSQARPGATSYRDTGTIRVGASSIGFDTGLPFMKPILIPASDIAGCSMTCFGSSDRHVDLLVPATGSNLMIPSSKELLDWCWANRKPMFSSEAHRDWLYKGTPLPSRDQYATQLKSRSAFDKQTESSCMGY